MELGGRLLNYIRNIIKKPFYNIELKNFKLYIFSAVKIFVFLLLLLYTTI